MTKYLAIGAGVLAIALGITGWLLKQSYETNGKLQQENAQLQSTLKEKADARKSRANTDGAVRRMPPADVIERLR